MVIVSHSIVAIQRRLPTSYLIEILKHVYKEKHVLFMVPGDVLYTTQNPNV